MSQLRTVSALFAAAAAVSLAACDRPTVVAVPPSNPSTVTVPVPVPGPAGPAGPQGSTGMSGSAGSGTTVIVTPAASAASN